MPVADLAELTAGFVGRLHDAGLPVGADHAGRLARAIGLASPASVHELYWLARVTLVSHLEDLPVFDRVFNEVFRGVAIPEGRGEPLAPPARTRPTTSAPGRQRTVPGGPSAKESAGSRPGHGPPTDQAVTVATMSREERLATTDFGELTPEELAELYALMRQLRVSPPLRPGRRSERHRAGDTLDLRATLRRARHTAGDPVATIRRRRPPRPRRVVVLCDISGSMEPYARAYVQFLHASVSAGRTEVFVFATRLTRLTTALAARLPAVALARAASAAPDWRSGTRIAGSLKTFLDDYGRRGMARGAVVVVVSDGWEHDDPDELAVQMQRLGRLAHRIIWVNPRTADPRYQPLAAGMAAALPHCDVVLSGHTVADLRAVVAAISG